MIRPAREADIPAVVEMLAQLHAVSGYDSALDRRWLSGVVRLAAFSPSTQACLVWDAGDGAAGCLLGEVAQHWWTGKRVATERAFWVDPAARHSRAAFALLRDFEAWARERGAQWLGMAQLASGGADVDRLAALYRRLGFAPAEHHWTKELR